MALNHTGLILFLLHLSENNLFKHLKISGRYIKAMNAKFKITLN